MKKYGIIVFLISLAISMAIYMLAIDISYIRIPEFYATASSPMGLPESYYEINAGFQGTFQEMEENKILEKLFQVVSKDDNVIAMCAGDSLYLYDPSGYYSNAGIKEGYFSKEAFQSGNEEGVIVCDNSAYYLMQDNGRVYYDGEYRNVVGICTAAHPLYACAGDGIIRCLAPGSLLREYGQDGSISISGRYYLADYNEDMPKQVEAVLAEAGWTVYESSVRHGIISERPSVIECLKNKYKKPVIASFILIIMGIVILRWNRNAAYTLGRSFAAGIWPSLAGIFVGGTVVSTGRHLLYDRLLWGGMLSALVTATGIMFIIIVSTSIGRNGPYIAKEKRRTGHAVVVGVNRAIMPAVSIICICLLSWFSYGDINSIRQGIKNLSVNKMTDVQAVRFTTGIPVRNLEEPLELQKQFAEAVEKAMKEGKAFASIESQDYSCSLIVGSKAFKKAYGLDPKGQVPAAYLPKGNVLLKKGDMVKVFNDGKSIKAPVVGYIDSKGSYTQGMHMSDTSPLVVMDGEDFVKAGYSITDEVNNMVFIDAESSQLNEYAEWMDKLEIGYSVQQLEKMTDSYHRTTLSYYGVMLVYNIIRAAIMLMFIMVVINMMVRGKRSEINVALFYGAGFRNIWLMLFPMAARILVFVGGACGAMPEYNIRGWRAFSKTFKYGNLLSEFARGLPGDIAKGMLAGLVLSAIISMVMAWGYRDGSQQFQETSS